MRRLLFGLLGLFLMAAGSAAQDRPADLLVTAAGVAATGQPMAVACALTLAVVPSNQYVGQCRITVGSNTMTVGGLPGDGGAKLVTVVLNGAVALRGVAEGGTGPFAPLTHHGAAGFPVQLHLDPLGRAWVIRSDLPGGGSQTVARGALTRGTVTFTVQ